MGPEPNPVEIAAMNRCIPFACCAVLVPAALILADEPQPPTPPVEENHIEEAPAPLTHIVQRNEMVLQVKAESRLEAGEVARIRLTPDAYSGAFEITAIERRFGRVDAGQTLLRFDEEPYSDQLRSATVALAEIEERLQLEQNELGMMVEANATRIERAEKALADAQVAWELWETSQGDRMLRAADLSTRQRESGVFNQREELAQLQSMYDGAELESATKEIVLERAMRSLGIAEEWLDIAREDQRITVDFTHGQRTRDVRDEVRYREEALAHARIQTAIAEARKHRTIQQVTRSHEDAVKRLEQLQNDEFCFIVTAPVSGLLARIDREIGDRLNARQVAAEIHDDSSLRLKFNATPNDLRVLREGQNVIVRVPELPEVVMTGRIDLIETIGRASGKQTHFNVEVVVDEPHALARIGLSAAVETSASLGETVTVPRKAVTWEDGLSYVDLLIDGETVRREVTIGASNKDDYQVIDGLYPGDAVIMPEAK